MSIVSSRSFKGEDVLETTLQTKNTLLFNSIATISTLTTFLLFNNQIISDNNAVIY